jgi:hypothetical protein
MASTDAPRWRRRDPAPAEPAPERRRHARHSSAPPLRVGGLPGAVYDISRSGICLTTDTPVPLDTRYSLLLTDLLDGSVRRLEAEAIWRADGRIGLRWADLTPEQDAWLLDRFQAWLAPLDRSQG